MFRPRSSAFAPPGALREGLRRTLGGVGRVLMTVGLLILLFVAYQLWGTGYFTARDQHDLKAKFNRELATTSTTTAATTTDPSTVTPPPTTATPVGTAQTPTPAEGDPVGIITMPWGDKFAIVEGTSKADLRKGPGHYSGTPFPGQFGNASIAGHRTTYLQPFNALDTAHVGQKITVRMTWGEYVYKVVEEPFPVDPHDVSVVDPKWAPANVKPGGAYLTLTTCNPKFSARQRLILHAELVSDTQHAAKPVVYTPPPASKPTTKAVLQKGLDGSGDSGPAFVWAGIVALVGLLWWWVFRHWRHPLVWLAGLVPFLPVLTMCYVYLERALPNGY